jgi:predicted phosphohydrolase
MTPDMIEYWERVRREAERANARGDFRPDQVFQLARRNVIVNAHLIAWRSGDLTWEQMLIALVVTLSEQNERFFAAELKRIQLAPLNPIVVEKVS